MDSISRTRKLCECGCGGAAPIAKQHNKKYGWIKGEPVRFIKGHWHRPPLYKGQPKLCECGCGQPTPVAKHTNAKYGWIRGWPMRFIHNHHFKQHGAYKTSEYRIFLSAKRRCEGDDRNYGGRGIKFLFESFEQFLSEVGTRPSRQHSLDRFPNNDGNYEPGNVRWASAQEQASNRSKALALRNFSNDELIEECSRRRILVPCGK